MNSISPAVTFVGNRTELDHFIHAAGANDETVVVVDATAPPSHLLSLSSASWQIDANRAASDPNVRADVREAEKTAAANQAQFLTRVRPDRVLVATCTTHLQAQFVVELAARGIMVTVATDRTSFFKLIDDVDFAKRWIDG
jgi:hypothetical protein